MTSRKDRVIWTPDTGPSLKENIQPRRLWTSIIGVGLSTKCSVCYHGLLTVLSFCLCVCRLTLRLVTFYKEGKEKETGSICCRLVQRGRMQGTVTE